MVFKLVHALFSLSKSNWERFLWEAIELTTLGTIADMVPLTGENRLICSLGLKKFKTNPNVSFQGIFKELSMNNQYINSSSIGFRLAPLFNASGRIGDPNVAVDLLVKDTFDPIIFNQIKEWNEKRKKLTLEQTLLAEKTILANSLSQNPIIVVCDDFHDGLIGLVSSRITEKFKKPSVVISYNGKGSARNVPTSQHSILDVFSKSKEHLVKFGGHKAACGLTIDLKNVDSFSKNIQKHAHILNPKHHFEYYDGVLDINEFPRAVFDELMLLEPFGMENKKPVFCHQKAIPEKVDFFGDYNHHLKFSFSRFDAVSFFNADKILSPFFSSFDLLYTPEFDFKPYFTVKEFIQNRSQSIEKAYPEAL